MYKAAIFAKVDPYQVISKGPITPLIGVITPFKPFIRPFIGAPFFQPFVFGLVNFLPSLFWLFLRHPARDAHDTFFMEAVCWGLLKMVEMGGRHATITQP